MKQILHRHSRQSSCHLNANSQFVDVDVDVDASSPSPLSLTFTAKTKSKTKNSKSEIGRNNLLRHLESNAISDCFSLDDANACNNNNNHHHNDGNDVDVDFFDYEDEEDIPFSFNANIREDILIPPTVEEREFSLLSPPPLSSSDKDTDTAIMCRGKRRRQQGQFRNVVQNVVHRCYQTCPGAVYSSTLATNNYDNDNDNDNDNNYENNTLMTATTAAAQNVKKNIILASSLLKMRRREKKEQSKTTTTSPPSTAGAEAGTGEDLGEEIIQEPSPAILAGIIKPLIPKSIWYSLTGREFYYPSTLSKLIQTSLQIATCSGDGDSVSDSDSTSSSDCNVDWKPADSKTKKLLLENDKMNDGDNGNEERDELVRNALLNDGQILVWMGKFMNNKNSKKDVVNEGYGSNLPLIKTISIIPLSPKKFAELLMDSDKVQSYNKMSLGRKDVVVFQQGVDTVADTDAAPAATAGDAMGKNFALDGEAKIVRNVTKPPLSKKLMEFVTLMYARRLNVDDDVSAGYVGSGVNDVGGTENGSYIVVTRAVSGGRWGGPSGTSEGVKTRGGGADEASNSEEEEMTRSEILLGVNLLRSIPGEPDKTEVTAVTHVYSPSVPTMLAGTVGVKGAIDFVKDIRALCK